MPDHVNVQQVDSGEMCCVNRCFLRVSAWFQERFKALGEFIASYPVPLIITSLVVCCGLSLGMLRLTSESDTETLYTPVGGRAYTDRVRLQDVFQDKTGSNFIQHSLTKSDVYGDMVFSTSNVLSNASLAEIWQHVQFIKNINVTYNDTVFKYPDVCAMLNGQCAISGEFVVSDSFMNAVAAGNVTYPMWNNIDISRTFAKTELSGNYLTSAVYTKITFHLRQDSYHYVVAGKAWENEFIKGMASLNTNQVSVYYASSQSLDQELNANTGGDITFFSITFTLMITYATIVAGGDMVSSRTWASWAGVVAAAMGIITSFGLVSLCGMKFVNIVGVTPFLVIGIGVDDMFLLMSSWADTYNEESDGSSSERKLRVKQCIGRTFASAGIGITITSLTDLLAFVIGASSVFISVRNFCVYTGVSVIFCYLYQCFFFSPCLTLHGQRVAAKRHCVTCLKVKSIEEYKEEGRSCWVICCCGGKPPTKRGEDERVCETLPRTLLPNILLTKPGKIVVMLSFVAYISVSIWGAYNLKQGLDLRNLVPKTSHFYSYTDVTNTHFDSSFPIPFIFEASNDYLNPNTLSSINNLLLQAGSDSDVNEASRLCWLFEYKNSSAYSDTNITTFIAGLKGFLSFVPTFRNDVEFSNDGLGIKGSRCYLFSNNIKDSNIQAAVMTRMRALADSSPLSVYVYHPAFIYFEQYVAILPSTLQTVGVALVVMTFVTFIFLPHPLLVLLVALNIVSIIVGIFGFLHFWNLSLSSITMIHLIMSVGFSVDFSVHVCSAFMLGDGATRHDRAKSAIVHAAGPILNGGISSFLGVIILVFSESYIFQSFFKIMFTVILFGMLHAVFLLPVVLSMLGPTQCPVKQVSPRKLRSSQSDSGDKQGSEKMTGMKKDKTEAESKVEEEDESPKVNPEDVLNVVHEDTIRNETDKSGESEQKVKEKEGRPSDVTSDPSDIQTSKPATETCRHDKYIDKADRREPEIKVQEKDNHEDVGKTSDSSIQLHILPPNIRAQNCDTTDRGVPEQKTHDQDQEEDTIRNETDKSGESEQKVKEKEGRPSDVTSDPSDIQTSKPATETCRHDKYIDKADRREPEIKVQEKDNHEDVGKTSDSSIQLHILPPNIRAQNCDTTDRGVPEQKTHDQDQEEDTIRNETDKSGESEQKVKEKEGRPSDVTSDASDIQTSKPATETCRHDKYIDKADRREPEIKVQEKDNHEDVGKTSDSSIQLHILPPNIRAQNCDTTDRGVPEQKTHDQDQEEDTIRNETDKSGESEQKVKEKEGRPSDVTSDPSDIQTSKPATETCRHDKYIDKADRREPEIKVQEKDNHEDVGKTSDSSIQLHILPPNIRAQNCDTTDRGVPEQKTHDQDQEEDTIRNETDKSGESEQKVKEKEGRPSDVTSDPSDIQTSKPATETCRHDKYIDKADRREPEIKVQEKDNHEDVGKTSDSSIQLHILPPNIRAQNCDTTDRGVPEQKTHDQDQDAIIGGEDTKAITKSGSFESCQEKDFGSNSSLRL